MIDFISEYYQVITAVSVIIVCAIVARVNVRKHEEVENTWPDGGDDE